MTDYSAVFSLLLHTFTPWLTWTKKKRYDEGWNRIVHTMLFVAASIDVVINNVFCICTACFAAVATTTITQRRRFLFFFTSWIGVSRNSWLVLLTFFRSLFLLLFEFFRVCCLHIFLRTISCSIFFAVLTCTHRKKVFFVALFFRYVFTFSVLYISSMPALHLIRTVPPLFMFMWLFSSFYFTFTLFRYRNFFIVFPWCVAFVYAFNISFCLLLSFSLVCSTITCCRAPILRWSFCQMVSNRGCLRTGLTVERIINVFGVGFLFSLVIPIQRQGNSWRR